MRGDPLLADRTAGTTAERLAVWLVVVALVAALGWFLL